MVYCSGHKAKRFILQCINGVTSNPVEWRTLICFFFYWANGFRQEDVLWEFPIGFNVKLSSAVAAILVGGMKCFWKGAIQGSFHKRFVAIGPVVSEEKIFMWISHRVLCKAKFSCEGILVERPNRWTHFSTRTIQWLFDQNFVLIEQMVSDKKIFMGISHRVLC